MMDVEAEVAAAASAALFVNLEGDTFDSLEISAFRFSCVLSKEAITIEYGGGSSYLSSPDNAPGDVDVVVCVVTTDAYDGGKSVCR